MKLSCLHLSTERMAAVKQEGDVPVQFRDADSAKEAQLLETWKAYKKGFQEGIGIFNKKPKKGISFLQVNISLSPAIARCIFPLHG